MYINIYICRMCHWSFVYFYIAFALSFNRLINSCVQTIIFIFYLVGCCISQSNPNEPSVKTNCFALPAKIDST